MVALGECLVAWSDENGDPVDAKAGAIAVAEVLHLIRAALTKK